MKKYSFRHTIKQGIAGLFHICKEELKMTVKDQGVLIFFPPCAFGVSAGLCIHLYQ